MNNKKEPIVVIDIERMKKALASDSYTLPQGLTREEMIAYICNTAKIENVTKNKN